MHNLHQQIKKTGSGTIGIIKYSKQEAPRYKKIWFIAIFSDNVLLH